MWQGIKNAMYGSHEEEKHSGKAVKWFGMDSTRRNNASTSSGKMYVTDEAREQVLLADPVKDHPVNLISIFGGARQGKSFLMNLLAGEQDLFQISNLREPCTQGVDLSKHFMPLEQFSRLNNGEPVRKKMLVGFVDAEGQGDRDITYDSRLVSPVLMASKVVVFNWKDTLQADRILNLLAVLARAAQGIDLQGKNSGKVFGHLHIVFRDWNFVNSDPQEVYDDLFRKESGRTVEVSNRNQARANLVDAFESINIWLLPPPVKDTATLSERIRFEHLQPLFQEKLRALRKVVSTQLQQPMKFNEVPLTGKLLSQIMPHLVEALNSDRVIMPESIYTSLIKAEAIRERELCEETISRYCKKIASEQEVIDSAELQQILEKGISRIVQNFLKKLVYVSATNKNEYEKKLEAFATRELELAISKNNESLKEKVSIMTTSIADTIESKFKMLENGIPMNPEELYEKARAVIQEQIRRIDCFPKTTEGDSCYEVYKQNVKTQAEKLFSTLELKNEKAITQMTQSVNEYIGSCKVRLTEQYHKIFFDKVESKQPFTLSDMHCELTSVYMAMLKEVHNELEKKEFGSKNFDEELKATQEQLARDINRRYLLEIRQVLTQATFDAKLMLSNLLREKLESRLPVSQQDLHECIKQCNYDTKVSMDQKLQGWSILKNDIVDKLTEIDQLAEQYEEEWTQKNKAIAENAANQSEEQLYYSLKDKLVQSMTEELTKRIPLEEDEMDAITMELGKFLLSEAAEQISNDEKVKEFQTRLEKDCLSTLQQLKSMNKLELEKMELIAKSEMDREQKEQELSEMTAKTADLELWMQQANERMHEKEVQNRLLASQIETHASEMDKIRHDMEVLRAEAARTAEEKSRIELESRENALARELAEKKAKEEELRRRDAEIAAQNASRAAALSARSAVAATQSKAPSQQKNGSPKEGKRESIKSTSKRRSLDSTKSSKRASKSSAVEEARKSVQDQLEKRKQERLQRLTHSKSKTRSKK